MNEITSLTSLLTRDLEVRSRGATGRALLDALELYCVDLHGQPGPLEFALFLRSSGRRSRQALEELLEWPAAAPSLQLIALVALAPDLDTIARRLGRGSPSDDTVSEVLAQATEALRWTNELPEGARRDFIMRHVRTRTRGEQRRLARHNAPAGPLPHDFDRAASVATWDEVPSRLAQAVDRRVITPTERELIETTRGDGKSLLELARCGPASYKTLHQQRLRAERRLRAHYRLDVAK